MAVGRFVATIEEPTDDFHPPPYETMPEPSHVDFAAEKTQSDSKGTSFAAKLLQQLNTKFSKATKTNIEVQSPRIREYRLSNSQQWFKEALRFEKTRDWLEDAFQRDVEVYFIVGYSTVKDVAVQYQQEGYKNQGVSLNPLLLEPILGEGVFRHADGDGSRGRLKVENQEVVCSWTARKVQLRPFSSKNVDKARLGDSCIWPRKRMPRGTKSDKDLFMVDLVMENEGAQ
ncbi:hypothetical protein FOXYS1_2770 [Fusarium oxysporum]|uniref:Uncharacterized protein n=1 Tax=Fusarium oxysporum TaxID=5507 RepID=A0A8H5EN52_FUSOX|nr:hypothetical protein FOXYS1_2770 [Fusarium oxysporum]